MATAVQPTADAIAPQNLSKGTQGRLKREDFLKLLTQQLTHQDPLSPMDNTQVLEQLSLLENMETVSTLTQTLQGMVRSQTLSSAAGLLGKFVTATGPDGKPVSGLVSGLTSDREGVRLLVNGQKVAVEQILEVRSQPAGTK